MGDDVFLKLEYGARDIASATWLRKMSAPRSRAALALAFVAVVAAAAIVVVIAPAWLRVLSAWLVAIALVQAVFVGLRALPHAMFRASAETAQWTREAREDLWKRTMTVDASEDGIAVTVGSRHANIAWRDCRRLASDARSHVLYHGASGFLAIPRRAFRTAKKDEAFRALAASLVPSERAETSETVETEDARAPAKRAPRKPLQRHAANPAEPTHEPPDTESRSPAAAGPRVGRNEPCPCGSGKKYKKCCLLAAPPERPR